MYALGSSGNNVERLVKVYRRVMVLFQDQRDYIEGLSPEDDCEFWLQVSRFLVSEEGQTFHDKCMPIS